MFFHRLLPRISGPAGVLLTLAAIGCTPSAPVSRELRMAYYHELVTLDPYDHADTVTRAVLSSVYEGLVEIAPGIPVRPWLADHWSTPDDLTWRLHIREGVRFHNGRPLTPSDVVASIERARKGVTLGFQPKAIESVRVVEDDNGFVEVVTSEPSPLLLAWFGLVAIAPSDFDPSSPVGTGPYRWKIGSLPGPVLLRRWKEYWGPSPDFDEASIQIVSSDEGLTSLIHQGRLDVISRLRVSFLETHSEVDAWSVVRLPAAATTVLGLNVSEPPLDDLRVRRAIALAIDTGALVDRTFPDGTADATGSLVPAEVFGYSAAFDSRETDPEQARRLLAAAGVAPGARLKLNHHNLPRGVLDCLGSSLAAVGLEVEPVNLPYEDFYRRLEGGSSQATVFSWNFLIADASTLLEAVVHTRDPRLHLGQFNGASFSDRTVDALIEEAANESQAGVRLELLRDALTKVREANVYIPVYHPPRVALIREPFVLTNVGTTPRPQDVHLR